MKVLLTTPFRLDPLVGGPAHTVVSTGLKLSEYGTETSFLTKDQRRFPTPGQGLSLRGLRGVDVVHCFGIWEGFTHCVTATARLVGIPYVLAPIGMLEPWTLTQSARKKQLALRLYQRRDLDRAAVVHATSMAEVENLRALGLTAPIALIPHGIEVPPQTALSQRPCVTEGKTRTLLFLSRLHPKKGLLDLVQAWAGLGPRGWRVVVAGPDEGGHRADVEAAVTRYGLERDFTFAGPVSPEEKHRLLCEADLFVLPTYSENFGLVVPEALSYEVPVLTTRGTPWFELEETGSGWWIATGARALTDALGTVLSLRPPQLRAMGQNGRKLVVERYSWSSVAKRHIELYEWILGDGARPNFIYD